MKDRYKKFLITAVLITASQILAFLFDVSASIALISSLLASVYYFSELGDISPREALAGIAGFIVSSFAVSTAGKFLILDSLCETAKSMEEAGSGMNGLVGREEACQGFFEAWLSAILSNPLQTWYIWAISIASGAGVAYFYRRQVIKDG